MEYKAKVQAKLKGNPVDIEITFSYDPEEAIMARALQEVEHIGLTEASIQSIRQVAQQLELDFEEDSSESYLDNPGYTSYASVTNIDCSDESEDLDIQTNVSAPIGENYSTYSQSAENQASGYTTYASSPSPFNQQRRPVTFTPKINGNYVPYHTEPVGISEDYLDHDFD